MTETKFVFRVIPSQSPLPPPCSNQREIIWRTRAQPQQCSFTNHPWKHTQSEPNVFNPSQGSVSLLFLHTHTASSSYLMAFIVSFPRPPLHHLLPVSFSTALFLFLPRLLSLWHARWFDIASRCQTTRPYFPSAVPSPVSLSLPFYLPNPLLTTIQFNLQQGLSGTAAGLPHHFFLPARGFAAVCRSPPMALLVVRPPHFLKLFIC